MISAGFGASCITPPLPCLLAGFARRHGLSRRVAHQLWARAVVLDDGNCRVGWVVCDLLEAGKPFVAAVRAAVDATGSVDAANVMVGATHTHAGPDVDRSWAGGDEPYPEAQSWYRGFLPHAVASSLVAAVADLSPVSLAWGEGPVQGVGADRRGGAGQPQQLSLLKAVTGEQVKGMRIVYGCHGTVLGPNNLAVSGDLIGAAVRSLEGSTGAFGRCSWAQGAAGDISSRGARQARTEAEAARLGAIVAEVARRAGERAAPVPGDASLDLVRTVTPLARKVPGKMPDETGLSEAGGPVERDEDDRSVAALLEEAMAARREHLDGAHPPEDEAELCLLSIGDIRLCFVPGEPFGWVERAMSEMAGGRSVRVVGYSNGAPGYIFGPDDEAGGGYEVLASPLTAEAGARVVAAGARLLAPKKSAN